MTPFCTLESCSPPPIRGGVGAMHGSRFNTSSTFALAIARKMNLSELGGLTVPYASFAQIIQLAAAEYAGSHPQARPAGWRRVLKRLLP